MGFFRKIFGVFGLTNQNHDHDHDSKDDADDEHDAQPRTVPYRVRETGPRKGFSVPAQVVVDRPQLAPVLTPAACDGGLQGLGWYVKRLKMDEDGDVADEFLDEVSSEIPEALAVDHHKATARFKLKNHTKPANVKKQILSDGKIIPFC